MNQLGHPADAPRNCTACERLVAFRRDNAEKFPDFFNGAVPSFGDPNAKLMVVGMAPGLKGANRTGRPFTGDYAGDTLFTGLTKAGLASGEYQKDAKDSLQLISTMIINVVRCVPPQNKPTGPEVNQCRPYLLNQLDQMKEVRVYLALGRIAHDGLLRTLGLKLKDYPFGHCAHHILPDGRHIVDSYHCSRYNTNTGRLSVPMFDDALAMCVKYMAE